jgi:FKBP-type peptidyl-prolyl cis-trans isomerase SlyD
MQIADRCVVSFHYSLTDDAGEVIDTSSGRAPLAYLHGVGNIVPGLEAELAGRQVGDAFKVSVSPEQGYGVHHEGLVQQVPRDALAGVDSVEVGMEFHTQGPQGMLAVTVTAVDGETVTIDGNHPLAGKTLNFDIEVIEVRQATDEEALHGHVHGVGGVEH